MEYIGVAIKAFATFATTLIYNKLISIFRTRHLYSTIHTTLDNFDRGEIGHTFTLVLGNAGKDKEKSVNLHFPKNKKCKIISRDYSGISAKGNTIAVDRILSGQKIHATVFLSGERPNKKYNEPQLKSEDTNGKVYFGYGREPVNAGPFILAISFVAALFSVMYYSDKKNGDPFGFYYKIRYWNFYEAGFSPVSYSDNFLITEHSPISKDYPLSFNGSYIKSGIIYFKFTIKNPTDSDLRVSANFGYPSDEFYKESNLIWDDESLTPMQRLRKNEELEKKHLIVPSELMVNGKRIPPREIFTFTVGRELSPKLKTKDYSIYINIRGQEKDSDSYIFHSEKNPETLKLISTVSPN